MGSPFCVDRQQLLDMEGEARLISSPPGHIPPGALAGERISRQQGRGLNFEGLRRYQPGDDIRLIDWQATARLRTPWVRLYTEERERPVFLLVDQRLDMFFSTRLQTKSVAAAKAAALFAWRSWHDGDRVGSLVFNDTQMRLQKCRFPRHSLPLIFDDIQYFNQLLPQQYPDEPDGCVSFADVLQRACSAIPGGAWVAIFSDFHDLDKRCDALLAALRRRCDVSAFVLLDDLHLRMPSSGRLSATGNGHDAVFSLSPGLRDDIEQHVTLRLARQQNRLNQIGIRVNHLVVTQDLLRQLQRGG